MKTSTSDLLQGLADLDRELGRNISDRERIGSALLGAAIVPFACAKKGIFRWSAMVAAGALIYRGLSGYCPLNDKLGRDTRHRRAGVPGNSGIRVEGAVEVECPSDILYRFWRNLEQLPRVMRHVESVADSGDSFSHWKVKGPLGTSLEWDAQVINDHPGELIAWQSLPGASVENAGSVRFEQRGNSATRIKVAFEYNPPGGVLGAAFAKLIGPSPEDVLNEDLAAFKDYAERSLASA